MNFVKKLFRTGMTKHFANSRRILLRCGGLITAQTKSGNQFQYIDENLSLQLIPVQSIEVTLPNYKQPSKRMFDSKGLLELTAKSSNVNRPYDMGDFDAISQENFAHALSFAKVDIDFANFSIDEMETVCSQNIENLSLPNDDKISETSEVSSVSYTETDIFIELPNSEIIEASKLKLENTANSASF